MIYPLIKTCPNILTVSQLIVLLLSLYTVVHGKPVTYDTSTSQDTSQESETATSQSESESATDDAGQRRTNVPTIRGGLNCSISDILEASGYGTETDFIVDNEMGWVFKSMWSTGEVQIIGRNLRFLLFCNHNQEKLRKGTRRFKVNSSSIRQYTFCLEVQSINRGNPAFFDPFGVLSADMAPYYRKQYYFESKA